MLCLFAHICISFLWPVLTARNKITHDWQSAAWSENSHLSYSAASCQVRYAKLHFRKFQYCQILLAANVFNSIILEGKKKESTKGKIFIPVFFSLLWRKTMKFYWSWNLKQILSICGKHILGMCVDTVITDELQMWISLCQNVWQLEFLPLCCDLSRQKYLAESTA